MDCAPPVHELQPRVTGLADRALRARRAQTTALADRPPTSGLHRGAFEGTAAGFLEIDLSNLGPFVSGLNADFSDIAGDFRSVRRALDRIPVLDLNAKACRILGVDRGAAIGRPLGDRCPDAGLGAWKLNLLAYVRGDQNFETETVMRCKDGRLVDVMLSCTFSGRPSEPVLVAGIVDITERIALQRDLARAQADLAHAARIATLGELTASIAHEVNQPLAAIVAGGNASLRWLDRAEPDIGEARQAISRMISEGVRASEIVARTRRMAMKDRAPEDECDIRLLVEEAIEITREQTSGLGARLVSRFDPRSTVVHGDRTQIQQVVINLIVNAAQAMTGQTGDREITVSTTAYEAELAVCVADTGPGLGDHGERLFDAFYTTKRDGMGMGLSIARTIIEAHNGSIQASPRAGGGSVFEIRLPASASD